MQENETPRLKGQVFYRTTPFLRTAFASLRAAIYPKA